VPVEAVNASGEVFLFVEPDLGYGIDLSEALISAARRQAEQEGAVVSWTMADMTRLPIGERSVDVVLCLWSAFYELLERDEQLDAIRETRRVLRPGGWALFEGRVFTEATAEQIATGARYGPGHRISGDLIEGMENHHYQHDRDRAYQEALKR
jgi:ubiquinone/menaquinone biosynthesis C-methylase UbiE